MEKIKQIGEARARQIIKLREEKPFFSVDELSRITGLGRSRIADIKKQDLACVSNKTAVEVGLRQESLTATTAQLAAIGEQIPNSAKSPYVFLIAPALAIFSGFAILLLNFFTKKVKGKKNERS
ncbi:MAG: helix-hairpin-helix domain-containing protein, partial [Candidatus Wildermuthbacteria bacterium]|nr:helix-hairpin-helix domain-containing protein [Candidatus Wildermuthbacteria bacterium]